MFISRLIAEFYLNEDKKIFLPDEDISNLVEFSPFKFIIQYLLKE